MSKNLDPALNTCYFCCRWKDSKNDLYVCDICKDQKRMTNYNFLLCGKCMSQHMLNHQHPKADLWTRPNLERHIFNTGCNNDL